MDDLNSSFGQLSTDAPEWRPGGRQEASSSYSTTSTADQFVNTGNAGGEASTAAYTSASSDLKASHVKEFVPGQGWNVNLNNSGSRWREESSPQLSGEEGFLPLSSSTAASSSSLLPAVTSDYLTAYNTMDPLGHHNSAGGYGTTHGAVYEDSSYDETDNHNEEYYNVSVGESTIPAGPSPSPITPSLYPSFRSLHSLGLADDALWRHYRDVALQSTRQMEPNDPRHRAVPLPFCNAFCLDSALSSTRTSFGYPGNTFQVTNRDDGYLYCLRRIDNCRSASVKIAHTVTIRWTTQPQLRSQHPPPLLPSSTSSSSSPTANVNSLQQHPGIVPFLNCFVAQRAIFFVHRFIPGAKTLYERLLEHQHQHQQYQHRMMYAPPPPPLLPESLLWSCLAQLVSAMAAIHSADLAVRCLDLAHILVTEFPHTHTTTTSSSSSSATRQQQQPPHSSQSPPRRWRLYLNCVGVVDALEFETRKHIHEWQQLDLIALGNVMLTLATFGRGRSNTITTNHNHNHHTPSDVAEAEAILAASYSRELHHLIMTLLRSSRNVQQQQQQHQLQQQNLQQPHARSSNTTAPVAPPPPPPPPPSPSIHVISRAIASHMQMEQDAVYRDIDRLHSALASEYDSSRMLRLMLKLAFINERPEFGMNKHWSQSGDCYLLSLFRDYVFHQADGSGNPVMDLGHVVSALNKLDAADSEKIVLTSRDGISLMVVSFADVARCLESAFHELCTTNAVVTPSVHEPY